MSLFLALVPPSATRDDIALTIQSWRVQAPAARWVAPGDVHLTLHFLGAYASLADRIESIAALFARWRGARFTLTLDHTGAFGEAVWWLGCRPSPPLLTLHAALAEVLDAHAVPRERRLPYVPHVTLARTRHALPAIATAPIEWPVERFALMARRPNAAAYSIEHEFPLRG